MAHSHAETPTMTAANYHNSSYDGAQMLGAAQFISNSTRAVQHGGSDMEALFKAQIQNINIPASPNLPKQETPMPNRRIVQVYIADPSDAVPLADAVLYTGEQKMTDLTDQELFFEIDIKTILAAHNEKRLAIVDKKIKDRTEYLEAAKVRDLKMVVVTVTSF